MRTMKFQLSALLTFFLCVTAGLAQRTSDSGKKITLNFNQTQYVHRWSQNNLHEFTPPGQEDLNKWTDMLSINIYKNVVDGDNLARIANQVLETYKSQKGMVVRTSSVPRTPTRPAEHLVVVVFGRPTFIEAVQARFKIENGRGISVIHSHRVYGTEVGPQMSDWLKQNGQTVENQLMSWQPPPSLNSL